MKCRTMMLPDGLMAIVCGPSPRKRRCPYCNNEATLLCDYPVPGRKSGTCDKPACPRHMQTVGIDDVGEAKHHCPLHKA